MSVDSESSTDTLGILQEKGDRFTKLSLVEKKRLADLEDAISYIAKETDKFRDMAKKVAIEVMNIHVLTPNPAYQRADGVNVGKEAEIATKKTMLILEGKLNKLLQRQSQIQNQNKDTKIMINHFRTLRLQTDNSHSRFDTTLAEAKEKIETILGESTKVVEERELMVERKEHLERINIEEQAKFIEEYEKMGKYVIEQNLALEDAMLQERKADMKGKSASRKAELEKLSNVGKEDGGAPSSQTKGDSNDLSLEEEIALVKEVGQLTSSLLAEQTHLNELRAKISNYESMFEQLKRMTGVESIKEMVSTYVANEEEMFSLYNYNQAINAEIDTALEVNDETNAEIKKFREDQTSQDELRQSTSDEMQNRLQATLELTSQVEEQNAIQQETILQISKKVSNLFFKLQCDQMEGKGSGKDSKKFNSAPKSDGRIAFLISQGVSESNVLEFMGCIEHRAVSIISNYLRVIAKDPTFDMFNRPRSPTPGPSLAMTWRGAGEPMVDLTTLSDDDILEDNGVVAADEKVLDLNSFKDKLQRKYGVSTSQSNMFRTSSSKDMQDRKSTPKGK